VLRISLRDLLAGLPAADLALQPGDRVYFPRAAQVYVTGQAVRPGAFRYEEGLTVHRLLALAGGPNERGSSKVRLVRLVAGRREERRAQPSDPVEPEDTLVVPERFF
jgi:polysaccharide export outer membrane protein